MRIAIKARWPRKKSEFEARLWKPMLWLIALICLAGTISMGLLFWTATHGSYHRWHFLIVMGNFCAIQTLVVGWVVYLNTHRRARIDGQIS